MKILLITRELHANNGGGQITRSVKSALNEIVGSDSLFVCSLASEPDDSVELDLPAPSERGAKIANIFKTGQWFISGGSLKEIESFILENKIDAAFIGRSLYGFLARKLKRDCGITVISIFMDIYPQVFVERIRCNSPIQSILKMPMYINEWRGEMLSARFSDRSIVLNSRDAKLFRKHYGHSPDEVIAYFQDVGSAAKRSVVISDAILRLLFVGSYYWPNVEGILWFVENVMPFIDDVELVIAGNGMEKISSSPSIVADERVRVLGRVEDLSQCYVESDVVIGPIWHGSGMKIKTIEALMHDKLFLGTPEAYAGVDGMDEFVCQTADEFIAKINHYKVRTNHPPQGAMRKVYEDYFGHDVSIAAFRRLLETVN